MTSTSPPFINFRADEELLRKASDAYHNSAPIMSDAEYDKLWHRHLKSRQVDPGNPLWEDTILDKVGAAPQPASGFRKVKHTKPMLSLDNVFVRDGGDLSELLKWIKGIREACGDNAVIVAEPKIDGFSVDLIYEDGIIHSVVTRGDGKVGEDVTANALASGMVPATIIPDTPWNGAGTQLDPRGIQQFRGEGYLSFAAFEALNKRMEAAGEELYSNPRNAASGLIRRKDPDSLRGCGLAFLCHGYETPTSKDYSDELRWAQLGIVGTSRMRFDASEEPHIDVLRTLLKAQYPTDGVVFKLDSFKLREELGCTSRAPRWAIALKFEQEQVETIVSGITVQVGRSGILTPVAELDPVEVDGSVVSRATLHNEDHVNRLGLLPGDTVALQKAGGVIPEIVRVVGKHTKPRPLFSLLKHIDGKCPSCGGMDIELRLSAGRAIVKGEYGGAKIYACTNTVGCKAQMAARVEHMASRGCLNIMGLGTEACDAIAQRGDIDHPFDILDKPVEWFASLVWVTDTGKNMTFGKARATKVVAECRAIGKQPLNRWITAIGIHSIGENTGKEISRLYKSAAELAMLRSDAALGLTSDTNRLNIIEAIAKGEDKSSERLKPFAVSNHLGPVSCNELLKFVNSDWGVILLARIERRDVKSDNYEPMKKTDTSTPLAFTGQTFAITGTLSQPRDTFKRLIEQSGGKVTDTISAKLTALVCGEGGGGKRDKAAKLGIPVWDEGTLITKATYKDA